MKKLLLTAIMLAIPAAAQTTLKDALLKHWKTSGELTLAVANAMPAEGYSFKPNPEEMSFGQQMAHIAMANGGVCALASGQKAPAIPDQVTAFRKDPKADVDKATAMQYLTATFSFCNDAVASVTDLDKMIGTTRKMTTFEWLWSYFTHTAHHRGQAEVYLRVKGIKPPEYTF